jgi:hypothetical protein
MLEFHSGGGNAVNSKAAVQECIDHAFGNGDAADCAVLIIHSTMGHNFAQMAAGAREACPNVEITGRTGSYPPPFTSCRPYCPGFEACRAEAPDDNTAQLYIGRRNDLIATPPEAPWRGVWVLDVK